MVSRILERELGLGEKIREAKLDLFKSKEHHKFKTFHHISRGETIISMATLIVFLEDNGFHPRTEDLEAILRRCDHDADRSLSFEEFCELTELPAEERDNDGEYHDRVN